MVLQKGKFHVVLLTPRARLLDVRAGSVVVPGHDGHVGILRNHSPMLNALGTGILQVCEIVDRPDAFYIVMGGFVRVNQNQLTVLAYDVVTFEGKTKETIDDMISQAQGVVAGQEYIRTQREAFDLQKAKLIVKLADYASGSRLGEPHQETG